MRDALERIECSTWRSSLYDSASLIWERSVTLPWRSDTEAVVRATLHTPRVMRAIEIATATFTRVRNSAETPLRAGASRPPPATTENEGRCERVSSCLVARLSAVSMSRASDP